MNEFLAWIRIDTTRTFNTLIRAESMLDAQLICEAQYGREKVLSVTPYHEGQNFSGVSSRSKRW